MLNLRQYSPGIISRYVIRQFFINLFICLVTAISLFLIFDLFDHSRIFIKENATFGQTILYLLYKIPLIVQLMMPVAVLISTLVTVGRMSQLTEITALRACGLSVFRVAIPLLGVGLFISILMLIFSETVVPWATVEVENLYNLDIRRKVETGKFSRANYWYRSGRQYFNLGFYNSTNSSINNLSIFEFNKENTLTRRIDTPVVYWKSSQVGWIMYDATETIFAPDLSFSAYNYPQLPLTIKETPKDFYLLQRKPETMSYQELGRYIEKLQADGVPVLDYLAQQSAKLAFPLVSLICVLISFPFALTPARSGTLTASFLAGVTIGFGYHIVHAVCISLGSAELLPVTLSAWSTNILFSLFGAYYITTIDY
ncbi:MAG: LPS export ABC transporter permease LptG [Deltaproteobacteria bacterium]|nr:LPS export ABC transporter permease LptG [Deltaproteobacteria bacterium]